MLEVLLGLTSVGCLILYLIEVRRNVHLRLQVNKLEKACELMARELDINKAALLRWVALIEYLNKDREED